MFLAWKEIKHSKGKFALIMAVVALVSYLVYFLLRWPMVSPLRIQTASPNGMPIISS